MDHIKWDGESHIPELLEALLYFIDDDDIEPAMSMSYGDYGNYLKKKHRNGGCGYSKFHIFGTTTHIKVELNELGISYEITWNKAAKLLHKHLHERNDTKAMGTPLDKLGLSIRAYNAAKRFGIDTVEELSERIDEFSDHAPKLGEEAREALSALSSDVPQVQTTAQVMSADYTKAVTLTKKIKANAAAAQESLWEVCKGLKEMHDGKLYKELGYQNFEEYTENEVGLSRFMAYKYISIGDIENVESIQQIGVTKLALLAKLDEPQREEIQQSVDLESTSVKELKEKIAALTTANDTLREEAQGYKEEAAEQRKLREELVDENGHMSDRISELLADKDEAKDTIQSLEKQIEELEDRPVDVAVQTNDAEIDKLTAQFQEELAKRDKDAERRLNEQLQRHKEELRKQREQLEKEADAADVEVEEEIREKAELDIQVKFATDALRRIARWLMSVDNENYTHYAMKKINEVLELINKEEK